MRVENDGAVREAFVDKERRPSAPYLVMASVMFGVLSEDAPCQDLTSRFGACLYPMILQFSLRRTDGASTFPVYVRYMTCEWVRT